jgi:glycosyltransferase involved in cell wall biosynthesis
MALGTPVVVAAQAATALGTEPGSDLLVAASPQDFASATLRLMDDANLRAQLSQQGRAYVEQQHDWQKVTQRLIAIYQQAIDIHTYSHPVPGGAKAFAFYSAL